MLLSATFGSQSPLCDTLIKDKKKEGEATHRREDMKMEHWVKLEQQQQTLEV